MQTNWRQEALQMSTSSSEPSFLQQEYKTFFAATMEKYGVQSLTDLESEEKTKEFFTEISTGWKQRKLDLYKAGKITADQLD